MGANGGLAGIAVCGSHRALHAKGAVESHAPQITILAHLSASERSLLISPSPDFTLQAKDVARCQKVDPRSPCYHDISRSISEIDPDMSRSLEIAGRL